MREHHWLSHRDGELGQIPVSQGAAELVPILDDVDPTRSSRSAGRHDGPPSDHRTISAWATEAWRLTGHRGHLWYATLTPQFHDEWGELNEEVGLWFEGSAPPRTPLSELSASIRLTGAALSRKHRALRAHASQTRPLETLVGSNIYRDWSAAESFVAATRDAGVGAVGVGRQHQPFGQYLHR